MKRFSGLRFEKRAGKWFTLIPVRKLFPVPHSGVALPLAMVGLWTALFISLTASSLGNPTPHVGFKVPAAIQQGLLQSRGETPASPPPPSGLIFNDVTSILQAIRQWEVRDWRSIIDWGATLVLLLVAWGDTLRRQVKNQTQLLREWARREVALRHRYEELFENANDIVYTTDLEGKLTSINRAGEDLTGYGRAEALGTDITQYAAPEYRTAVQQMLKQKIQDGIPTTYSMEIVTRDGRRVPLEVSSRLIYADGNPVGIQGIARDITERKSMEQKLLLREKRLASFFSAAPAGLAILDNQLRLIQINETLAQLTGRSPQENIGKTLREVVPKLAPTIEPAMKKALREQKAIVSFSHEGETPGQPGVVHYLVSSYFPIPALEGESSDLATIVVDVTDRKRAEKALQESEERLNSILSSLNDAVRSTAPDGQQVLYLNPAAETIYGRRVEEFIQDPRLWINTVHPVDRKLVEDSVARLKDIGASDVEFRIIRGDGEIRWLHDRSHVIRNSEGTVIRLDGISTDITQRKHAEESLRLYGEIFARSNEAVAILDNHFHFLEQNQAHRKLLGYSDDELRKLTPAAIMGEKTFANSRFQSLRTSSIRIETPFRTQSGKMLEAELSAFSITSNTGEVVCYVGLVRDISAQKRIQLERQKAREAAEAANRAKGEFLANMSHEIRTPLNGVLGMTDLALNTALSKEQREYLTMVKTSGEALLTVINDILDFSKIEAGWLELSSVDFDLRDSLGETLKSLRLRADQKSLELALHVASDVPYHVKGDPTRLRQIVVNLVGNGIKFTDHGEVVLHVSKESEIGTNLVLHFVVADTGIGIPEDKQQIIFDPFAQADSSATRRHGGTGLGLSISSQLVELMGGRLWVKSQIGKGSCFHFTAKFSPSTSHEHGPKAADMKKLVGLATLVVDDNATNRRLLEEILSSWGMRPAVADGGCSGLAAMQRAKGMGNPFPLVLIDANMPAMDGFTMAERINQDPELYTATIMMLTSASRRGDAHRCSQLGIAAYLHKPLIERDLLQAVLLALSPNQNGSPIAELITRHTLREKRCTRGALVAEDDAVNRQLAEHLLTDFDYAVTSVSNGLEAVDAIRTHGINAFDIVLMDVQMPEMDGLEATAAIRTLERGTSCHLPIIAMTAHAMKGDRDRFLRSGMDGYVSKPIRVHQLHRVIEETLQNGTTKRTVEHLNNPPNAAIDWKHGLARLEGDSKLFHELLKIFANQAPATLTSLRKAIERKDASAIERTAHALKGSLSNFGAEDAIHAASLLEAMARDGQLEQSQDVAQKLEEEVTRVLTAIETTENEVAE